MNTAKPVRGHDSPLSPPTAANSSRNEPAILFPLRAGRVMGPPTQAAGGGQARHSKSGAALVNGATSRVKNLIVPDLVERVVAFAPAATAPEAVLVEQKGGARGGADCRARVRDANLAPGRYRLHGDDAEGGGRRGAHVGGHHRHGRVEGGVGAARVVEKVHEAHKGSRGDVLARHARQPEGVAVMPDQQMQRLGLRHPRTWREGS
mmetsp:Transcript_3403/g.11423  ORF Transcript_3403/g.11423 Transcript_3403/m.11423 type:complete len:206 (-) Transcript_3403:576-1193(-)